MLRVFQGEKTKEMDSNFGYKLNNSDNSRNNASLFLKNKAKFEYLITLENVLLKMEP